MRAGLSTGMLVAVVALSSACGTQPRDDTSASGPASRAHALPCAESDQSGVVLDVPGPGRPTPEKAVAPYAGALQLVAEDVDGSTVVVGLTRDATVFRVYQVTKRFDGWWPEGYAECRAQTVAVGPRG